MVSQTNFTNAPSTTRCLLPNIVMKITRYELELCSIDAPVITSLEHIINPALFHCAGVPQRGDEYEDIQCFYAIRIISLFQRLRERQLRLYRYVAQLSAEDTTHRILSC